MSDLDASWGFAKSGVESCGERLKVWLRNGFTACDKRGAVTGREARSDEALAGRETRRQHRWRSERRRSGVSEVGGAEATRRRFRRLRRPANGVLHAFPITHAFLFANGPILGSWRKEMHAEPLGDKESMQRAAARAKPEPRLTAGRPKRRRLAAAGGRRQGRRRREGSDRPAAGPNPSRSW